MKEKQQGDLPHEKEENSGKTDDSESEPWCCAPAPQNNETCGKPLAGESAEFVSSEFQESQEDLEATWDKCLQLSLPTIQFTNSIFSSVWDIYGRYLDVHLAIWRMFMKITLQALISIDKEFDEISFRSTKIYLSRQKTDTGTSDLQYYTRTTNLEKFFGEVKRPICDLSEILGPRRLEIIRVKLMEYRDFGWRSMSLLSGRAERIITVKVCVISDLMLCQCEINNPRSNEAWRKKIEWYGKNNFHLSKIHNSRDHGRDSKAYEKHTV